MSQRLVDAASRALASRTSRRGFFRRAAIVGSAVVTAPAAYALRPVSAYQALVLPADCPPGSQCRSGWTEFCCVSTGVNTCPPGSVIAGWWRAEGSNYCGGTSRYYMDCNSTTCSGCGCGASGTCGNECTDCDCHCMHDNCDLWKECCTRFRYGQCNNQIECVGPIICRVVTCVPPWEWDSTCTRTDARSDETRFHDSACLHPPLGPYPARPAVVRNHTWLLRDTLTPGAPDRPVFTLGTDGDTSLMGDWTGAGVATAGVVRGARTGINGRGNLTWYLRHVEGPGQPDLTFDYGVPGDIPVVGDWTGNGVDTVGVVRGNQWLLRTRNSTGQPDISFTFGQPGDIPVVGDWDGDGRDGIGVVRGTTWLLRNTPTPGAPDHAFDFGDADGIPVVGDWDGDGISSPGRFSAGTWQVTNRLTTAQPDLTFQYGETGDVPLVWRRMIEPVVSP